MHCAGGLLFFSIFSDNMFANGEVSEWSNVRHSKCRVSQGTVGSNPTLSAVISTPKSRHSCVYFLVLLRLIVTTNI
mgnify:CR=1 FL=1